MAKNVVSLGEMMVQMNPIQEGPLRHATTFRRYIAGTEGNTIVGLERLGINTIFITKLGDDELGKSILITMKGEGVDMNETTLDEKAPTGVYFIQRGYPAPGRTLVNYYRENSAASKISPSDIDESAIQEADLLHVTGITPALSENCRKAVDRAVNLAVENDILISFDTNIRTQLWEDGEAAIQGLKKPFQNADFLFTGTGDLDFLFNESSENKHIKTIKNKYSQISHIVIKQGSNGATLYSEEGKLDHSGYDVEVIDELGAGDAFDAAFLASKLKGHEDAKALKFAVAAGAITVTARGDIEPLPDWNGLEIFINEMEGEGELLR